MSQILGASRMAASFQVGDMADQKLTDMLTLYKAPATIRDMKQVFFYLQATADIGFIHPIRFLQPNGWDWTDYDINANPPNAAIPKTTRSFYYLPIGTQREMDISRQVNDLIDIRVPKDKYVIEINLAECNIEADSTNWQTIPDKVFYRNNTTQAVGIKDTFKAATVYSTPAAGPDPNFPNQQVLEDLVEQATKLSQPETLYVRIRELDNGEPYNWTVTNSGQYSEDKSHQLVVRHGDVNYAKLTLEFGHLLYKDYDYIYKNTENSFPAAIRDNLPDPTGNTGFTVPPGANPSVPPRDPIERFDNFEYIDYNSEVYNAVCNEGETSGTDLRAANIWNGATYVNEYVSGFTGSRKNKIGPTNRPPFIEPAYAGLISEGDQLIQGCPLKYNQQCRAINFRFLIRIIHMF